MDKYFKSGGMSRKSIEKVLSEKFNSFIASIDDSKVRELVRDNTIITGGCIASMLLGERVNDYDLYFSNEETVESVIDYYRAKAGIEDGEVWDAGMIELPEYEGDEPPPYRPLCFTSNAITLSDSVQIILRFYGTPADIHKNYDFVHCTNYWVSDKGTLRLLKDALESLMCKQLRYQGSLYPVCSILRIRKFLKRGWTINAGQVLKILLQISELDLYDIEVLRGQLIGVDSLYFERLLSAINDKEEKLDYSYLATIIDKIFE